MVKGSVGALALVLSQALWVLPAARPAEAQVPSSCYLPPFTPLVSPCVPHDVPAGPAATVADLAVFAWQEFIALNWVAMDPATTGMRGRPNTSIDIPGFLGVKPDSTGNYPLVVWQTYRHKNELFPADGVTDATFDSRAPTYKYQSPVPTPAPGQLPSFQLFNNLDETSQIGLDFMFAHATSNVQPPISGNGSGPATGIRVAYEAKVNRAVFDYANKPPLSLTNPNNNYRNLSNALGQTFSNLPTVGGTCNVTSTQPIVELPCGDLNVPGDPGEGAIEIKAAWRALTPTEISGGKFFTRKVIYYTGPQGNQRYNNAVWGLVALHIIHKTRSFPAFVFATWEQVDNYDDVTPSNPENIAFQNLNVKAGLFPNIPVTRAHPIHSQVASTNASFHAIFKAGNPNSVWQYYKLVGVQATPTNQPPATAPADALSYFFLANIMVETNQTLQNFVGGAPAGAVIPGFTNVYLNGAAGSPFTMGGCQGCHGFQGQANGGDMSILLAGGPNNTAHPDSLDSTGATAVKTFLQRTKGFVEATPPRRGHGPDRPTPDR
ncbi:MAG: hypothetical protein U1E17_05790 [Geminicoccaceae bacterium]